MKRFLLPILIFTFFLASCGKAESIVQTAVVATMSALPSQQAYATYTVYPTYTLLPTYAVSVRDKW